LNSLINILLKKKTNRPPVEGGFVMGVVRKWFSSTYSSKSGTSI